jgi:hypothetical protein
VAQGQVNGVLRKYRADFKAVLNNTSTFTLPWTPDPDLLMVIHCQYGRVWMCPAMDLNGTQVVFPTGQFNNGGVEEDVTLLFLQPSGTSFDNSDANASLLATNHLGSPSGVGDRSATGRGIYLRNANGVLREVALDASDNIVVLDT